MRQNKRKPASHRPHTTKIPNPSAERPWRSSRTRPRARPPFRCGPAVARPGGRARRSLRHVGDDRNTRFSWGGGRRLDDAPPTGHTAAFTGDHLHDGQVQTRKDRLHKLVATDSGRSGTVRALRQVDGAGAQLPGAESGGDGGVAATAPVGRLKIRRTRQRVRLPLGKSFLPRTTWRAWHVPKRPSAISRRDRRRTPSSRPGRPGWRER